MIEDRDEDSVPGLKEMAGGQALDGVVPIETDLLYYEDEELDEAVLDAENGEEGEGSREGEDKKSAADGHQLLCGVLEPMLILLYLLLRIAHR
jgi:hypothetical protein